MPTRKTFTLLVDFLGRWCCPKRRSNNALAQVVPVEIGEAYARDISQDEDLISGNGGAANRPVSQSESDIDDASHDMFTFDVGDLMEDEPTQINSTASALFTSGCDTGCMTEMSPRTRSDAISTCSNTDVSEAS
eukprot:TRINITY_DN8383_c0_g1_i2.p1 TRINITY_DN8383_c0_g1~~TRINITY_DN8383_c0_g1_i2.p1  ORF type:complete len:134 (+),score=16.91 TRINITY_DN8383_c0_g1_i2:114-515(+)